MVYKYVSEDNSSSALVGGHSGYFAYKTKWYILCMKEWSCHLSHFSDFRSDTVLDEHLAHYYFMHFCLMM